MKKSILLTIITLTIFVVAFYLWNGLKSSTNQAQTGQTNQEIDQNALLRTSEGGNVTVNVLFNNPLTKEKDQLVFRIAMDTHSVDLDGYNLSQIATLKTSDGREFKNFTQETKGSGHHRTIYLKLKSDGVIKSDTQSITMYLKDIAGVPTREFVWEKQYLKF